MTSLTTFLLGNFFFNLKQLSKFEWVFLFFFLTQIWHLTKKRKKKQNEEKKYEINGPGQANKKNSAGGINRGKKKRTFCLIPKFLFFFPCDQWQQVTNDNKCFFLRQARFACPNDCVEKKRNNSLTKCKRSRRRIQPKKKQHCCPQLKKKDTWAFLF